MLSGNFVELPTDEEIEPARRGEVAVIGGGTDNHVRAVVKLGSTPELMLMIDRPVDTQIIAAVENGPSGWSPSTTGWTTTAPSCR